MHSYFFFIYLKVTLKIKFIVNTVKYFLEYIHKFSQFVHLPFSKIDYENTFKLYFKNTQRDCSYMKLFVSLYCCMTGYGRIQFFWDNKKYHVFNHNWINILYAASISLYLQYRKRNKLLKKKFFKNLKHQSFNWKKRDTYKLKLLI